MAPTGNFSPFFAPEGWGLCCWLIWGRSEYDGKILVQNESVVKRKRKETEGHLGHQARRDDNSGNKPLE